MGVYSEDDSCVAGFTDTSDKQIVFRQFSPDSILTFSNVAGLIIYMKGVVLRKIALWLHQPLQCSVDKPYRMQSNQDE